FSFGDYFKKDAIKFGWEFILNEVKLDKEQLVVTIFKDDDEAGRLWQDIAGLSSNKIIRLGEKDNFWAMGDIGPCGPCSEIHYDKGESSGCKRADCSPSCDCGRFLEVWNLVFMMFEKKRDGSLAKLDNPSIDTGMGLERLSAVSQDKDSNFETDLFYPLIAKMEQISGYKYKDDSAKDVAFNIIADHIRAIGFLIADNVTPGNDGRGYVLRRIMRRAFRYSALLEVKAPFAGQLIETLVDIMADDYKELASAKKIIQKLTLAEEESFKNTLESGLQILNSLIEAADNKPISGQELFKLYDTYGFPIDLAEEIIMERGLAIDKESFESALADQKLKGRSSRKALVSKKARPLFDLIVAEFSPTIFRGYDELTVDSKLLAIFKDGAKLTSAQSGDVVDLIIEESPFYGESGGQVSDQGILFNDKFEASVLDLIKLGETHILHRVKIEKGEVAIGMGVVASVDKAIRAGIRRSHTATHLLHASLRNLLGNHINQAGSLVESDKLRFDYSHYEAPSKESIKEVERLVNNTIQENIKVDVKETDLDSALKSGAMALFEQKYQEKVRLATIGRFSAELCGGTHCMATGDIGLIKIVSDSALAAGVRRIEAVTGQAALDYIQRESNQLAEIALMLKSSLSTVSQSVRRLVEANQKLLKDLQKSKEDFVRKGSDRSEENLIKLDSGVTLISKVSKDLDVSMLRIFIDEKKNQIKDSVIVVGSVTDGKALIAVGVSKGLTDKVSAKELISSLAKIVDGSGGGRADFAQAGGKNVEKIQDAINAAEELLTKIVAE
ncbi:MAG: alanine--tRNA ligase, partial [Nitrospinota bacterium]